MRRIMLVASLALALMASAAPAAAAESFQFRSQGSSAYASFTNVPPEELVPGTYFFTDVWAADSISTSEGQTYEYDGVCVFRYTFTIDADGSWTDESFLGACGNADLTIERRLTGGSIVASIPVEECLAWDDQTGECLEVVNLGTIDVDLTLTASGPTYHYHGASTGGTAGIYQYTSHGSGTSRNAVPAGTVTLTAPDGPVTDLTGGADGYGSLQQSRDGYVDVIVR